MGTLYTLYVKRCIDLTLSLALFALVSPVFIVLAFLLSLTGKGKPFFFQRRPGLGGRSFTIIKFKTMRDAGGRDVTDAERMTAIGRFVRAASLDEIPQLINVILGDMSLIGPRPLLEEYLPLYDEFQRRRHEVRPGVTGWAQVNGRNRLSWEQKFTLDVWYVDNCSFLLDCRILLLTLKKVIQSRDISSGTSVTMEKFTKNPSAIPCSTPL